MSGDLRNAPVTFTYLTDNGPTTVDVSALMPQATYRYVCRCGCGKEFEAKGSDIQAANTVTPQEVQNGTSEPVRHIHIDESPKGDQTGVVICSKRGHEVEFNDLVNSVDDEETQDLTEEATEIRFDGSGQMDVEATPEPEVDDSFDDIPVIGDRVWSKATGEGPFTIIAGTFIDVVAAKLEIADPIDGVRVCERSRSTETLRLDAWLVRTQSGRVKTFPKVELTLERQFKPLTLTKVLIWLAIFSSLIALGWAIRL